MSKNRNPAAGDTASGAGIVDLAAERVGPKDRSFRRSRKAPSHQRLRRHIEIVHHWSVIGGQAWLIVLRAGADKKTVAAYTSLDDAIDQLESWSQKLGATMVGRGAL